MSKGHFFGGRLQVPYGGEVKMLGPQYSWPDPLHRALEAGSDPCAPQSVGSLLFMLVTTGDAEVTGTGGRTGLSWPSWGGMEIPSSCSAVALPRASPACSWDSQDPGEVMHPAAALEASC